MRGFRRLDGWLFALALFAAAGAVGYLSYRHDHAGIPCDGRQGRALGQCSPSGNTGCCNSIRPRPSVIFLNSARLTET